MKKARHGYGIKLDAKYVLNWGHNPEKDTYEIKFSGETPFIPINATIIQESGQPTWAVYLISSKYHQPTKTHHEFYKCVYKII